LINKKALKLKLYKNTDIKTHFVSHCVLVPLDSLDVPVCMVRLSGALKNISQVPFLMT